ncbi:UDP-N-acetylmuramoyl-tripeptide--D-alanyl-D-alanine ligase [Alkalimarinus sediminis]|uniref:UDP-N-acetylmuramoyl-tripeptide--D-alanyl-D-alanine ligase n=1 Tax=Alkalimarinus sediminis TaxID=1632866 RepID=A0A9E8KPT6_9ALTE|nr:UDP-N-acetylmuramoyl-tripeptide--D-alanyl-D-alanine ligase [Alkalimarinus sediminis]UZW73852.1 UDP-N-acetylmuramoyl-tripeptide--D-alanyl-D-alanine ligase [Alkalimarinus sediminis]
MIGLCALSALAEVTHGELRGSDQVFCSVSTDTRTIQSGDLFVALQGPNFDGNQYVHEAKKQGAAAALVSSFQDVDIPQVKVADTLQGLGLIAAHNRQLFDGKVAAITGSSGKTSVKEMLAELLSREGKTLATAGNFNNHIGAPLTLLRMADEHKFAVIELGASAVGEINYTASIAKPDVSILTNAGSAHLEGFGSYDNIVKAKGEIISSLADDGVAVLNADDPAFGYWQQLAQPRLVRAFSLNKRDDSAVWAESVTLHADSSNFELCWDGGRLAISLPLPGEHNIANALAAACAANVLGVDWQTIQQTLNSLRGVKGRLEIAKASQGYTVINDTYNANPASTRAALDVLAKSSGFRVAVLGDMGELGANVAELHEQVGLYAKEGRADALYAVGEFAKDVVRGYGSGAQQFKTKQALVDALMKEVRQDATYLVKGSRGSAMETVVEEMLKQKVVA